MDSLKLWLLESTHDEFYGFIVRARSASQARFLASERAGKERYWLNPTFATAKCIGEACGHRSKTEEVVLDDFLSG